MLAHDCGSGMSIVHAMVRDISDMFGMFGMFGMVGMVDVLSISGTSRVSDRTVSKLPVSISGGAAPDEGIWFGPNAGVGAGAEDRLEGICCGGG